jgi:hypothetical protein
MPTMPIKINFFDDVGVFTDGTFEEHLAEVKKVLTILQDKGFTVKPSKCKWCCKECYYLGYAMQTNGIKLQPEKIEAMLKMERPKLRKQLRSFLGMVNYYRMMWPKRAHILKPLTNISGKNKFKWGEEQEKAFKEIKALVAEDVLLHFPEKF